MEPDEETALKLEINNFLWTHAPGQLCMKHAETLACSILAMLQDATGRHSQEQWEPLEHKSCSMFRVRNGRVTEDTTRRGWCYSFWDHFDIHWDNGTHVINVPELSERGIFKTTAGDRMSAAMDEAG